MERKVKPGLTPAAIVAIVFGSLGMLYSILGIVFSLQPADGEIDTVGTVFAILGGVLLVIALILWICTAFHRKRLQTIVDGGKYIWGEIADITCNYHIQVNNRHPYVVLVRYADRNGVIHLFRSTNLKTYPDRSVIGKQVKVYYEDESYKRYYIDLEGILPKVIEH